MAWKPALYLVEFIRNRCSASGVGLHGSMGAFSKWCQTWRVNHPVIKYKQDRADLRSMYNFGEILYQGSRMSMVRTFPPAIPDFHEHSNRIIHLHQKLTNPLRRKVPMQKHRTLTLQRIQRFASDQQLSAHVYPQHCPVKLTSFAAPDRIRFEAATQGDYLPIEIGHQFGPIWSTHWVRVEIQIPTSWKDQEVHLLMGFHLRSLCLGYRTVSPSKVSPAPATVGQRFCPPGVPPHPGSPGR